MDLRQWLELRQADILAREGENSLVTVGPDKPLGSRGFPSWEAAAEAISIVGPPAKEFRMIRDAHGPGCWIYLWHPAAFAAFLRDRAAVLDAAGWPTEPADFVAEHRATLARPRTPLFDLIADAYGDKLNPGRRGFALPAATALQRFAKRAGFPDPATVYFANAGFAPARRIMNRATRDLR